MTPPPELARLIEALRRPEAYPHPVGSVEVRQTHISVVFLAGAFAYKVKKPVNPGFLDFTTLERRLHFCREEVRLNRRLAPDVYLGVMPVVEAEDGLVLEGEGEPVEHAVKMRRLPDDAVLSARLERGQLSAPVLRTLGRRIADFHAGADAGAEIARFGRWEVVAGNARENLVQSRSHVGSTLSETVHRRLERSLERRLEELRDLVESRAEALVPRDTHGDLHLDHVYLFPERDAPGDLVVIDCIEFNERFRYADPVADMAFMVMDLARHGRRDLGDAFDEAYFDATGDVEGRPLLPFYVAYRAAVRGKVQGMKASEEEVPEAEREAAVRDSRAHWLLALSELEEPGARPCLVLVGGLPGTGKSTVAEGLAREAGFTVVSSDRVRKELAGLDPETSAAAGFAEGIYTSEWNDRTYAACLERVGELLFEGERVVVDASFREASRRRRFLQAASEWGVRGLFLLCTTDAESVRDRLEARKGGASDADWSIYLRAAAAWEPEEEVTRRALRRVATDGPPEASVERALAWLRAEGLT
ncbi:MAG: AAA family ATPase [Longimicrobiales bacterium]|nr:AAA family ATPase [Longimicrobiales bacterium]